jgi:hypothetical protein
MEWVCLPIKLAAWAKRVAATTPVKKQRTRMLTFSSDSTYYMEKMEGFMQ